jgi:hypothetical protein
MKIMPTKYHAKEKVQTKGQSFIVNGELSIVNCEYSR